MWWVAGARTAEGWSAEFKIPFKTLRYEGGPGHDWGINFSRRIRRKNEVTYWSPVSRAFSIYRASSEGDLTGLPALQPGRNMRIKPYLLDGATRQVGGSEFDNDFKAGLDFKAGVTPSMALDLTVNPDFAQAEADEQQVNLTQFSLFYPEKREFFLENAGIFYVGDIPRNQRQAARFRPPEEDLLLFFSRQIGLTDAGEQVPLYGGARLTGRAGAYGLGFMTMQSQDFLARPSENYTVARVRRDVLANSDVGAIVTSRDATGSSDDFNRVFGADANFRFFRYFSVNGFAAKSETPGETRNQGTSKAAVGWEDSRKRLQASVLHIGEGFRDDLGFVRRTGVLRAFFDWAWLPQPEVLRRHGIRQIEPHASVWTYYDPSGEIASRLGHAAMQVLWNSGSYFEYAFEPRTEAIATPFRLRPDVEPIPPGRYDWTQHLFAAETNHSRALSASLRYTTGGFWSGRQNYDAVEPALSAGQPPDVRRGSAGERHRPRDTAGAVRHHAGQPALRVRIQHQHVPRCADPVSDRCEAVLGQRPVQPDSPAAERSVRRLQRPGLSRYTSRRGPRRRGQVHAHDGVLTRASGPKPRIPAGRRDGGSPLFPAGDHAVRHAHGGGVADGIDCCHHERFGSLGRRVDETAVCDRPGTRRHPSATIAAGIARADLRIQTVCRTRHRQRDRDRRRLLVHLVPGDRSSRTAVTHDVTDLAAVRGGAGRLRPGRHIGGEVKARVRRVRETRFEITCGACNRDIAVVPRAVRRGA